MQLPFTHEQFLDVFGAFNRALWPAALLLWIGTLGAVVWLFRRGAAASRLLAAVLAVHWAWSGAVYHLVFFRPINPAATLFGLLFLVEAALLVWWGLARHEITFRPSSSPWACLGGVLIIYSFVYPVLGLLFGLEFPRLPLYGVPCPTTLLTVGALLLVPRRPARPLAVLPALWAGVGGSAAFLLDIRADLALLVAGLALVFYALTPARRSPERITT
jgi:hypothetical protein